MFDVLMSPFSTTWLVGLTVGLLVYWIQRSRKYMLPPGPPALPLVGNLLQVDSTKLHQQAFEWSKKYGSVISLYLGSKHVVFVNDIDTTLEVLVKKSTDFASRPHASSTDVLTEGGNGVLLGEYGHTWHLHKKSVSKALRKHMQGGQLERSVWSSVTKAMAVMEKQKGPFDINDHLTYMIANLLTGLFFGEKDVYRDPALERIIEYEREVFNSSNLVWLEDYLPLLKHVYKTKNFKMVKGMANLCHDYIYENFEKEERSFDKENIRHFVDCLLLTRYVAEQEGDNEALTSLTNAHLVRTCTEILLSGTDVTRITLSYALLYMMVYPEIQERVQEEIDRVVGKDRLPGVADRPNLSYTEAVLYESMRLSTVRPFGVFHQTTCDTSAGGYDIPKGTTVVINHWALHHDPGAWDDVEAFKPERFLDENGKRGPKPRNWLPFSAGKRVCLGEFLAKPELHLIFAALMQRFTWQPEPGLVPRVKNCGSSITLAAQAYKVVLKKRL